MGTAFEVFWKVWVGGFCVYLLLILLASWVLQSTNAMNPRSRAFMRILGEHPDVFLRVVVVWFFQWPFLLLNGIAIAMRGPRSR